MRISNYLDFKYYNNIEMKEENIPVFITFMSLLQFQHQYNNCMLLYFWRTEKQNNQFIKSKCKSNVLLKLNNVYK